MSPVLSRIGSLSHDPNLPPFLYLSGRVVFCSGTLKDYFNSGSFRG
jgi:hypothetical protein